MIGLSDGWKCWKCHQYMNKTWWAEQTASSSRTGGHCIQYYVYIETMARNLHIKNNITYTSQYQSGALPPMMGGIRPPGRRNRRGDIPPGIDDLPTFSTGLKQKMKFKIGTFEKIVDQIRNFLIFGGRWVLVGPSPSQKSVATHLIPMS